MAEEQKRTGRILVTLLRPDTGEEMPLWTKVATLEERDRLTQLHEHQEKREAEIRERFPAYVAYQRAALADVNDARKVAREHPGFLDERHGYDQAMEDLQTEMAFEVVASSIDTNDKRIGEKIREGIEAGPQSAFWRAQPVQEVREAAERFRKIAGVRG